MFRPFIDRKVYQLIGEDPFKKELLLTSKHKQDLIMTLTENCIIEGEKSNLLVAINNVVRSLVLSTKDSDHSLLKLPEFNK